jgi:hypothetical protein
MNDKSINALIEKIKKLSLSSEEKKRMLTLFQIRGTNKVNKSMTYSNFVLLLKEKNANITDFIIGPKWNRLVFIDVDVEI